MHWHVWLGRTTTDPYRLFDISPTDSYNACHRMITEPSCTDYKLISAPPVCKDPTQNLQQDHQGH